MPDQIQLVVKSLKDFKNNRILLAPILVSFGLYIALGIFALLQFIIGRLIFGKDPSFSVELAFYFGIFYAIDLIILILINIYVMAAQYGMLGDVVLGGKSSFKRLFQHGKTLFKPVLTFTIAELAIFIAPAALLALLALVAFLLSPVVGYVLAAVFVLVYILFLIAFSLITVFNVPILVSKRLGGFKVIIESFRYGKSHFEHAIITVAVIIALWFLVSIISTIVGLPYLFIDIASSFGARMGAGLMAAYFISYILSIIVSSLGGIILALYLFNSYFSKNPFKNWK